MMVGVRWWSMYVTSTIVGYLVALVLLVMVRPPRSPLRVMVHRQAAEHADAAARREGPYLAPVTAVGILLLGALLVGWLS